MKTLAVFLITISSFQLVLPQQTCQPSKHAKLPAIVSMTYHKARPLLLRNGWQPYQTIHVNEAKTHPATSYGNGQLFWNRGYYEIEDCAGTGMAPCIFLFEDAYGNRLRIGTEGEETVAKGRRYYARVTSYKFVCD